MLSRVERNVRSRRKQDERLVEAWYREEEHIILAANSNPESIFKSPLLLFSALGAISIAIWWGPLASLFALAWRDEHYTHILLILPMSAALIFMDWKPPAGSSRFSVTAGSAVLLIALLARAGLASNGLPSDVRLSLNMLAFVTWCIGAFILCFGGGAFRRALFPLCFLLWMVPFPQFVLDPLVSLLQRGSTASAHLFFAVFGVPVEQTGTLVSIPGLTLEVAPECSSIRSSTMLLVTTMFVAQWLLVSFWRKAVVMAAAIPLSVLKNGFRIFSLGMLATKIDPGFLTGRLHHHGGIIFFLIALIGIFLLLWILRRGENRATSPARRSTS
jgi:exosortase